MTRVEWNWGQSGYDDWFEVVQDLHDRKADVVDKVVADGRNWTDPAVYSTLVERLVKDLKAR